MTFEDKMEWGLNQPHYSEIRWMSFSENDSIRSVYEELNGYSFIIRKCSY